MLRISQQKLSRELGVERRQYARWTKEGGRMSVQMLVRLSNVTHISLSEFLVVSKTPVQRVSAESYVVPSGRWTDVRWNGSVILEMFGADGKLGISKTEAAERLGLPSYQYLDRWASSDSAMDVNTLLDLLNEFHLDASLFFDDENGVIPVPIWEVTDKHVADILEDKMQQFRRMEIDLRKGERLLAVCRLEGERLKKEKDAATRREAKLLKESSAEYRSAFSRVEWSFNKELWQALPEMFEMTKTDFCRRFGIASASSYSLVENIRTSDLVDVCNELRISISHFFIRKGEEPAIHDRAWYEVSKSMFRPIAGRMEIMDYLFGKWSVFGYTGEDLLSRTGVHKRRRHSTKDNERARVITLADICTEFNLSPTLFFEDENRKGELHFMNRYELLILNAIEQAKEVRKLRKTVRKLKNKLKEVGKDDPED